MSATTLVKDPEVEALIDPLLPREHLVLGLTLAVPARRNSGPLVGTAYDYAVRFELLRRHPNARSEPWVAEAVLAGFGGLGDGWTMSMEDESGAIESSVDGALVARWRRIVDASRAAVAAYTSNATPTRVQRTSVVQHALRLARIDAYYRANYVDEEAGRVDTRDVEDVLALLDATPIETLGSSEGMWLNPTFGAASARVGGADADLISSGRLIDLKTATNPTPRADLRQLLAYLFLARAARREDRLFPKIEWLAVYYARHRRLWVTPVADFTEKRQFADVEARFFARAAQLFGRVESAPKPRPKKVPVPAAPKAKPTARTRLSVVRSRRTPQVADGTKVKRSRTGKPARGRKRTSAASAARGRSTDGA